MTEQVEIKDIAKETIDILNYFDLDFVSKIPIKVLNKLKGLANDSTKTLIIDKSKKLEEQNITEETKDFIALIYYNYIASKEEKKEILKIWNQNELLYQKDLNHQYNSDNIFKKNKEKVVVQNNLNLPELVKKESFIKRIMNFIKNYYTKRIKKI